MKKLMLISALALGSLLTANAAEINRLWINTDVAPLSGSTRQGVAQNGKFYLLNSHYGGDGQGAIEVWSVNGKEGEIKPDGSYLSGTNIALDDAGNIVARKGVFPNPFVGSPDVFIYNPSTGDKKVCTLDQSVLLGGRVDFWGHISGDVMSKEGGVLLFSTNSNGGKLNEVVIANGEHRLGGQQGKKNDYWWWTGIAFGTTGMIGSYNFMPGEAAVIEGPGTGTTPKPLHHMVYGPAASDASINVWTKDGEYYTPERNISTGFDFFQLRGENYIVYPRGGNNADGLVVAKATVIREGDATPNPSDVIVAKTFAEMNEAGTAERFSGTANTGVHINVEVAADGRSALIYQYSPRNFIAVYEFIPDLPVEVLDVTLNRVWLNEDAAGLSGTTRQGVGKDGKFYLLNSHYNVDANGAIEVWTKDGKEGEITPDGANLQGTNIALDDAGNIIARKGVFPNPFPGSPDVFIYNPTTGAKKTFTLDTSKIFTGRVDFWGHVAGDVMSENGGYLMFGTSGQGQFNEVKIANGEHVLGGRQGKKNNYYMWDGVSFGTTGIISSYDWMPNEAILLEGPGAGNTPKPLYHMVYGPSANDASINVWTHDGEYYTPERNITSGFEFFKMGDGETYIVYSRGGNNADGVAIAKARVQRAGEPALQPEDVLVAKTFAIMNDAETAEKYNGTANTAVHFNVEVSEDGTTATIYQYSPRNFISVLELKFAFSTPGAEKVSSLSELADVVEDTEVVIGTNLTVIATSDRLSLVTDGKTNIGLYTNESMKPGNIIRANFEATYTQHALVAGENAFMIIGTTDVPQPREVSPVALKYFKSEWNYLYFPNVTTERDMEQYDCVNAVVFDDNSETTIELFDLLGVCGGLAQGTYHVTGFFALAPESEESDNLVLKFVPTEVTSEYPVVENLTAFVDFPDNTQFIMGTNLTVVAANEGVAFLYDGASYGMAMGEGLAAVEAGDIIKKGWTGIYSAGSMWIANEFEVEGKAEELPTPAEVEADDVANSLANAQYVKLMGAEVLGEGIQQYMGGEAKLGSMSFFVFDMLGAVPEDGVKAGMYNLTGFWYYFEDGDEPAWTFVISAYEGAGSVELIEATEGEARYFDINGIEVANPANGKVYIKVQGSKAVKVLK